MLGRCPYNCNNQTSDGYCKTTGCINLNYRQNQINQNAALTFPITIVNQYFAIKQDLLMDDPDYGRGIYS